MEEKKIFSKEKRGGKDPNESQDEYLESTIQKTDLRIFQNVTTEPLDIYELLGQNPNDDRNTGKFKYRKKIAENMSIFRRKKVALASQILMKQGFYNDGQKPKAGVHTYTFKEDIFHYVTTCDFAKLVKTLLQHKDLINSVDENGNSLLYLAAQPGFYPIVRYLLLKGINPNIQNNLGSTALHVSAFYGHKDIVELLLLNGANFNIVNKMNNKAENEAYNDDIKLVIQNHIQIYESDPIQKKIRDLRDKDCLTLCHKMYTPDGDYIGIFGSIKYKGQEEEKLKNYIKFKNQYTQAYHGTKFQYADSIIQKGFIKPSKRGGVESGHIELNREFNGIKNWADAIFVSQSMYMACHNVYAEKIEIKAPDLGKSYRDFKLMSQEEKYRFVFQISVKNGSYKEFKHTVGSSYKLKDDEPEQLEWRIEDENQLVIQGFYFIREKILEEMNSHQKIREMCNEDSRLVGIMTNQQNTLGQRVQYWNLCLLGHNLKRFEKVTECDVCGQNYQTNYMCNKCSFARCDKCVKSQAFL